LWSCSLSLLLRSCGEPEDSGAPGKGGDDTAAEPTGCFAEPPSIDVGTGADAFEPLEPGAPVVMVHGPQGGWHLLGSVRTHNMEDIVRIQFVVTVESSGEEVANNSLYVQTLPDPDDPCVGVYPGMYAYLVVDHLAEGEADTPPELLAYETLVFTAVVSDDSGAEPDPARTVTASVQITATPDPVDLEDGDSGSPGR
jgi:hypothetical protein